MTTQEYNEAVDLYADNVYRFVLKTIRNRMTADDIVQETFMRVWAKHKEVQFERVKSYLFTTAYHATIDWIKKDQRTTAFESEGPVYDSTPHDLKDVLHEALDKLPEIQRTVVMLRDYEGYNYQEIAEITSLNESQVKVYIFRARQSMKSYLVSLDLVL